MTTGFAVTQPGTPTKLLSLRLLDVTCVDETDHEGVWPWEGEWVANDAMRLRAIAADQHGESNPTITNIPKIDLGSNYEDGRTFRQNRVLFSKFIRSDAVFPVSVSVSLFLIEEDYLHDDIKEFEPVIRTYGEQSAKVHSALSSVFGALGPAFKIASAIGKVASVIEPLFASALADMGNDYFPVTDTAIAIASFDAIPTPAERRFVVEISERKKIKGTYRLTFSWELSEVVVNQMAAVAPSPNSIHTFSVGLTGNILEYKRSGDKVTGRVDVLTHSPPFDTDIPSWHRPASITHNRGAGKYLMNNFFVENNTGNIIRQWHINNVGWRWEKLTRQFPDNARPTGHLCGCAWSEDVFHIFGVDGSGNLLQLSHDGGWRWFNLGNPWGSSTRIIPSTITAASRKHNEIDIFGLDRSNNLLRFSWRNRWQASNLGRGTGSAQFFRLSDNDALTAVSWDHDRLDVFGLGNVSAGNSKRSVIQFTEIGNERNFHNLGSGFADDLTFCGSLAATSTSPGFHEIVGSTARLSRGESMEGTGLGELTFGGGEAWVFRDRGRV